jgi:hypothetical protein
MNRNRGIHTDHVLRRRPFGSSESKRDRYGRISFNIPEVRLLSALGMTTGRDGPLNRSGKLRTAEGRTRDYADLADSGGRRDSTKVIF